MKPSILDRVISWVDPVAGYRRMQFKSASNVLLRGYDAAKTYPTSEWTSAVKTSANAEIGPARAIIQSKARDLTRNNPYAHRALNVIVSNVVGAGILANIKGRNKTQQKKLTELWKMVAETPLCDYEGKHNFYALQALALRSIVESGEVLALKDMKPEAPRFQLLESDFIDATKDDGTKYVQGIELDNTGRPVNYILFKQHPGDAKTSKEVVTRKASSLVHLFRQDRPGQIRGVSWSHAVIETFKDFDDYQYSTLIRQKIAACFGGFITSSGNDSFIDAATLKARREAEMQLTPGKVRFLQPGESFQNANPPGVDGYAEFTRESMRRAAAGYGISYEALTGDYSQVNFSSGRMGHIEFRRNIDNWRWNMLIPGFCDPYFQMFLEWARAKGLDTEGAYVEWVPPAHVMIDPVKETNADKEAVKAGFKSRSQVIRENGNDPESVLEEIKLEREAATAAGVSFDTDTPAASTSQGVNNSEDTSKENAGAKPDTSAG